MDAADHSVGDYGRTDGIGRNLVYGDVERQGIWLIKPDALIFIYNSFNENKTIT